MRLRGINQSIWMYGFPTRKHHYTDRGLSKRYNVSEKYAELKFVEHSNPTSPYRTAATTCNGNKINSPTIKVFEKEQVDEVLPLLTKCHLYTRNGMVAQADVAEKYVSYGEEVAADANICYYGNVTGWHRYEAPPPSADLAAHRCPPSTSDHPVSRFSNVRCTKEPANRIPSNQAECISKGDLMVGAKVRLDRAKSGDQPGHRTDKVSCEQTEQCAANCAKSGAIAGQRVEDTSLLKAVKLEDTTVLFDILNTNLADDINATDSTGRTVLSYAVLKNCALLVERILSIADLDVNKADNEGNAPLHFCAQAGQVEAVSLLLNCAAGIEVDIRNVFGFTPLMKAALQGRTKCAKLLIFAGASPTMRDTGRALRAEQWARFCGRYVCADVIEKYARNQLLSKTASYGHWGEEPELGLHFLYGRLQPPAIAQQNALNERYRSSGIKSKLKRAFYKTNPSSWSSYSKNNSYSMVSHLTKAALCVSSPVLPNSSKVPPAVKSLIKPFVIPRIEITADPDASSSAASDTDQQTPTGAGPSDTSSSASSSNLEAGPKSSMRRLSYLVKFRKKSVS